MKGGRVSSSCRRGAPRWQEQEQEHKQEQEQEQEQEQQQEQEQEQEQPQEQEQEQERLQELERYVAGALQPAKPGKPATPTLLETSVDLSIKLTD